MSPNPVLTLEDVSLADEVREFCERHSLFGHLAKALELARQYFTIVGDPVVSWEHDPENDDEYLVVEIRVQASVSECVAYEIQHARAWTQFASLPEVRLIRLLAYLVE
jgi:hypothetical protein